MSQKSKLEFICKTLDGWPGQMREAHSRKTRSPFRSAFDATIRKLRFELQALDSTAVVLSTAHTPDHISFTTGFPRADKTPTHPGVIVAADTRHGALKWPCDRFASWTANLHAIALTLERLRLADLYGVTGSGQQYSGWKMLPGPITPAVGTSGGTTPKAGDHMNMERAADLIGRLTGKSPSTILRDKNYFRTAMRDAAKQLHPDAGGSNSEWQLLQSAATLLNSFHDRR